MASRGPLMPLSGNRLLGPAPGQKRRAVDEDGETVLSCNQIRSKLRNLVDHGGIKVTHLQRDLGVTATSYRNFMSKTKPWEGEQSSVFWAGQEYFRDRKRQGIKEPSGRAKKRKVDHDGETAAGSASKDTGLTDVSDIHLDGEHEGEVEIFDAPGEVRKKVNAFMRRDGVTQPDFLRALSAQMLARPTKIDSVKLNRFRGYSQPDQGIQSDCYYAAYIFFEKLRIKEGGEKSNHRMEMEKRHRRGVDRSRKPVSQNGVFMRQDETFTMDEYCGIHIHGRGR